MPSKVHVRNAKEGFLPKLEDECLGSGTILGLQGDTSILPSPTINNPRVEGLGLVCCSEHHCVLQPMWCWLVCGCLQLRV